MTDMLEMMIEYGDALKDRVDAEIKARKARGDKLIPLSELMHAMPLMEIPLKSGYIAKQYLNTEGSRGVRFTKK